MENQNVETDLASPENRDAWKASKTCLMLAQMGMEASTSIVGDDAAARAYCPASDIKWLFPMILDASSHAVGEVCKSFEDMEERSGGMRDVLAQLTGDLAHSRLLDIFAAKTKERLDRLEKVDPEAFKHFTKTFTFMCILAYSVAVKGKLRTESTDGMNPEVRRYLELSNLISELPEATVRQIMTDLCGKSIWSFMFEN